VIVGSNQEALYAARLSAINKGYRPLILSATIQGETLDVARMHTAIAREVLTTGNPIPPPACILSGGETTVTLKGTGKGGRNQEFALAAALEIAGMENVVVFSAGTDGTDGPTNAAGAFSDSNTVSRSKEMEVFPSDFLKNNDSYHFFEKLGDLVITGPTHTNVMDLRIILIA
jgi:hydroxypyruvate reductase